MQFQLIKLMRFIGHRYAVHARADSIDDPVPTGELPVPGQLPFIPKLYQE